MFRWTAPLVLLATALPALASPDACRQAARDHTSFKAILSDGPGNAPQYETVKRDVGNGVEITRYIGDQKRSVRDTIGGLFAKENIFYWNGVENLRMGFSHSVPVDKFLPLRPGTSADYTIVSSRSGRLVPVVSKAKLTVGGEHDVAVGDCHLHGIDLTITTASSGKDGPSTVIGVVYVPDLAYPVDMTIEVDTAGTVKRLVTKVRDIEPWQDGAADAKP